MITLTLPYPISANRYWASRVIKVKGKPMPQVYVTAEAKEYREKVAAMALAAGVRKPIDGRVTISAQLYPHRPLDYKTRQRKLGAAWEDGGHGVPAVQCLDVDNTPKVLLDSLKGIAFGDDRWVRRLVFERMEPDDKGARVVITIAAMPAEQPQADLLEAA